YTMQELYDQPLEPVEYLVDGLLAPGLYILGGSPKVGKSWMALQLCLAVCGGGAFLGRATRKSEVLYLALEDGPQRLHSRALRLADTAVFRRQKRPVPCNRMERGDALWIRPGGVVPARPSG
ncbi:MAG TPA: AAA family ATPase, partial [Candidatus Gemmiger stercoravium]|nr:AAA family ATPase [Candidatus Gemmiger stercoravium]